MGGEQTVTIRTDGGVGIGLGHLRRTATLARALFMRGVTVRFLVDDRPGAVEFLRRLGISDSEVLRGPEPDRTIAALRRLGPATLVTDSYALTGADLWAYKTVCTRLVCIDDLAALDPPGDIVTNGAPFAEELPYRRRTGARYLLGAAFALVDDEFAPGAPGDAGRMFVVLGGGSGAAARHIFSAIDAVTSGMTVVWIRGPLEPIESAEAPRRNRLEVHRDPARLPGLLAGCAFGVSAGGQTALELAAMGVPFVGLRLAENQRQILAGLQRVGACLDAGPWEEPSTARLEHALRDMMDGARRAAMRTRGPALIDRRGPARVAEAMLA